MQSPAGSAHHQRPKNDDRQSRQLARAKWRPPRRQLPHPRPESRNTRLPTAPLSALHPRRPAPKPISPFPEALFDATEDPASFQDALVYHSPSPLLEQFSTDNKGDMARRTEKDEKGQSGRMPTLRDSTSLRANTQAVSDPASFCDEHIRPSWIIGRYLAGARQCLLRPHGRHSCRSQQATAPCSIAIAGARQSARHSPFNPPQPPTAPNWQPCRSCRARIGGRAFTKPK